MISLLFALGSGSTLLLSFLVLTNPRKVNVVANRWLALFIFCLFSMLIDEPLYEFGLYRKYPNLIGFESLFVFLMAPSLYLCVCRYTLPEKSFNNLDILHFIPYFLTLPFLISTIFQSSAEKLALIESIYNVTELEFDFASWALILQIVVYISLSYLKIIKHQRDIWLFASDTSNINLNWLKNSLIAIAVMVIIWMFDIQFYQIKGVSQFSGVCYFVSIYIIAYYAFRQEEIYPYKTSEIQEIKEILLETATDQKNPRINNEELEKLKRKVKHLMEVDKLYLDETLSLPKLAERVETSVHNLSFILNEGFNENFFQFVNTYRVEEAKNLLSSDKIQQLSMVGIAFESGFSSKTTFNTTFKRITGISPSEFIAQKEKQKITS